MSWRNKNLPMGWWKIRAGDVVRSSNITQWFSGKQSLTWLHSAEFSGHAANIWTIILQKKFFAERVSKMTLNKEHKQKSCHRLRNFSIWIENDKWQITQSQPRTGVSCMDIIRSTWMGKSFHVIIIKRHHENHPNYFLPGKSKLQHARVYTDVNS